MKILHTSDWHLGRTLYGKKRYAEFEAFLDWLLRTLAVREVDVLIVAGDIFDTTAPSNRAQQLYYRFLSRATESGCRHVVVTGGNHDSPSFLDAPKELLNSLNVYVVGAPTGKPEDELLTLFNSRREPELLVCAVPCLRDRDVRSFEAGESFEDKERKLIQGIAEHYRELGRLASEKRVALGCDIPIVATGHLFATGGRTVEGDGVRDLYIGSLAQISSDCFPPCIDYLALGHLHSPQKVDGSEFMRYSGAPLVMFPGEADQTKSVVLAEFTAGQTPPDIELIPVPVFQELQRIAGSMETIEKRISVLRSENSAAWLEIIYEGQELRPALRSHMDDLVAGSDLQILRVKNTRAVRSVTDIADTCTTADDLNTADVFTRCLEAAAVPDEQRPELLNAYGQILASIYSEDPAAE